jgi:hypothetical protein
MNDKTTWKDESSYQFWYLEHIGYIATWSQVEGAERKK